MRNQGGTSADSAVRTDLPPIVKYPEHATSRLPRLRPQQTR
jgi:hypothetical protein